MSATLTLPPGVNPITGRQPLPSRQPLALPPPPAQSFRQSSRRQSPGAQTSVRDMPAPPNVSFYRNNPKYTNVLSANDVRQALNVALPQTFDGADRDERLRLLSDILLAFNDLNQRTFTAIRELLRGLVIAGVISPQVIPPTSGVRWANGSIVEQTEGVRGEGKARILPSFFWAIFANPTVANQQLADILNATQELLRGIFQGMHTNEQSLFAKQGEGILNNLQCDKAGGCIISERDFNAFAQSSDAYRNLPADRRRLVFYLLNIVNAYNLSKADILALVRLVSANTPEARQDPDIQKIHDRITHLQNKTWRGGNALRATSLNTSSGQPGILFTLLSVLNQLSGRAAMEFLNQMELFSRGTSPSQRARPRGRAASPAGRRASPPRAPTRRPRGGTAAGLVPAR